MTSLAELRCAFEFANAEFERILRDRFPGADRWTWYRALAASKGADCRRNEDTTRDAALSADKDISAAHDEYIRLLHVFYRARDGERGVLGGRGL
jgi:hypothetical protein